MDYRLYRLRSDGSIIEAIDFPDGKDDEAAIAEAIRIDHAASVEVWCGERLIARVDPNQAS